MLPLRLAVPQLSDLASMDDVALRKAGLVSARSRQAVQVELARWGMRPALPQ